MNGEKIRADRRAEFLRAVQLSALKAGSADEKFIFAMALNLDSRLLSSDVRREANRFVAGLRNRQNHPRAEAARL